MIHIYSGNGKGKTTAAMGLAVRAAGAGLRVHICQLLKNGSSSEISVLKQLENVTVRYCTECDKFTFLMNATEKEIVKKAHDQLLDEIALRIRERTVDVVVMDEMLGAYNAKLLDRKKVRNLIESCPRDIELILTGRAPAKVFRESADYYSAIREVKHPYHNGVKARKGIEY